MGGGGGLCLGGKLCLGGQCPSPLYETLALNLLLLLCLLNQVVSIQPSTVYFTDGLHLHPVNAGYHRLFPDS